MKCALLHEGDQLLEAPTLGHNHLFFRRYGIEAQLASGRPDEARRYAAALARYAEREPTPLTDLLARRAMLLADAAEGRLSPETRAELLERGSAVARLGYLHLSKAMLSVPQAEERPYGSRPN